MRDTFLTARLRATNIAGMSEGVPAASKKADISLVELERQLEGALIEYERLSQAWPKESHILTPPIYALAAVMIPMIRCRRFPLRPPPGGVG